jgi:hypothetical protein
MSNKAIREAFEAHARQFHLSTAKRDGHYVVSNTRDAFEAFKAAIKLMTPAKP